MKIEIIFLGVGWVLLNLESFVNNELFKLLKSGMSKVVIEYIIFFNMSKYLICIDLNNNVG